MSVIFTNLKLKRHPCGLQKHNNKLEQKRKANSKSNKSIQLEQDKHLSYGSLLQSCLQDVFLM